MKRTPEEIEDLKAQWLADPCWDIEATDGFEEHRQELAKFGAKKEAEWKRAAEAERLAEIGHWRGQLACGSELAEYVIKLERRLARLEIKFDELDELELGYHERSR